MCWHDNCPSECDVGSLEPSGRKELKQCVSVQEDLQYVCRVNVLVQPARSGTTAMVRATAVDRRGKRPAISKTIKTNNHLSFVDATAFEQAPAVVSNWQQSATSALQTTTFSHSRMLLSHIL